MGLTITKDDGTVSSDGTGTAEANNQAQVASDVFILGRPLHVTADGKIVEEDDPTGVTLLGGVGSTVSAADVKKYQLDASHRLASAPVVKAEAKPEEKPIAKEPVKTIVEPPKGK